MPETRPSPEAIQAWTRLIAAQRVVLAAVETELKAAGFPPLAWYDALLELGRAPRGLRPLELEGRLLLAQHSVSRLLERLHKAGLVARAPCAKDGRGHVVTLTAEGAALRARMWPAYRAAIQRHLGAKLGGDAQALAALLRRLLP